MLLYPIAGAGERHRFFDQLPDRREIDAVIIIAALPCGRAGMAAPGPPGRPRRGRWVRAVRRRLASRAGRPWASTTISPARQAVNHLLLLGHERIARPPAPIVPVPWGIPGGARGMDTLLSAPQPPTAVFAHSDEVAFGALQSLSRAGHLCLDLLHDHLVEHEQIVIPTRLIIRRTTAPTRTPGSTQPEPLLGT